MHEVLVNRLGGLSLPRKSVVRLTDRPNMTLDVYRGRKTTMQQQQQLTKRVKSYLTDTTDFLNHLPSENIENTLLVSFDVQSLYSNIPHQLGEKAINYWLRKFPNDCPARFPKEFILDGINFIVTNNTFCFNSKHYHQTKGTAMNTKFAPVYATLVIGYLEEICTIKLM